MCYNKRKIYDKGNREMTEVVAALIRRNNKFLICRRAEHKTRGLLWEFVGGKREKGESDEEALIRECNEELDIKVGVKGLYVKLVHAYPDMTVQLSLYCAEILEGEPVLKEHKEMKWITPDEISLYEFCPADYEILDLIRKDESFRE